MIQTAPQALWHHPKLRQFVKFCLIGFSSMLIDVGVAKFLMHSLNMQWILAGTLSFLLAVTNGYIWNSLWTFRGMGSSKKHHQYMKFLLVNVVGWALNIGIMKGIFILFTGQLLLPANPPPMQWNIAKAVAIVIVSAWNFLANAKWTFGD